MNTDGLLVRTPSNATRNTFLLDREDEETHSHDCLLSYPKDYFIDAYTKKKKKKKKSSTTTLSKLL